MKKYEKRNIAGLFQIRTAKESIKDAEMQEMPRNLYHSLIYEGVITILFADTGVGKSIFAVQVANEISKTDKVIYLDLELSDKQFQNRYSEEYQNPYQFEDNLYRVDFTANPTIPPNTTYNDYFIASLVELIMMTESKIVFIDNMTKLVSSDTDGAKDAKPLMDKLNALKLEYGLTIILLEHTKKIDEGKLISLNHLQGSKMKPNFVEAAFSIGRSSQGKNVRYIKQLKSRSAEIMYDKDNVIVFELIKENSFLQFKFEGYGKETDHLKEINIDERNRKILSLKKEGHSNVKIGEAIGLSDKQIGNILKKIKE